MENHNMKMLEKVHTVDRRANAIRTEVKHAYYTGRAFESTGKSIENIKDEIFDILQKILGQNGQDFDSTLYDIARNVSYKIYAIGEAWDELINIGYSPKAHKAFADMIAYH